MNAKWYVSTLIIILALIGLNQEQTKVANQQIVLQFNDEETTLKTSYEEVLVTITQKLQDLGISIIEIIEDDDAQISIQYYSEIDAEAVKEFLSQNDEILVTYHKENKLPFDHSENQLPENCSLVISDLKKHTQNGSHLNGKLAFELKEDYNRFSNPVVIDFNEEIGIKENINFYLAFKINKGIAIAITNILDVIPEVRAGPHTSYRDC